jgi:MFS family permease
LTAGAFAKYGKKRCIHIANILSIIGCILITASGPYNFDTNEYPSDGTDYLPVLFIGRLLYGVGTGCFTVFVNSFISEVSPNELTGPMGIAFQFFVCVGVLIANLIGMPMINKNYRGNPNPLDTDKYCLNYPLQFDEETNGINKFMRFEYWRIVFGIPILFSVI